MTEKSATTPLCVDLDGTLIRTDVLQESITLYVRRHLFCVINIIIWFLKGGRAFLKQQLASRVHFEPGTLPYNEKFLEFLESEHRAGRPLYLVTASDIKPAKAIADYLGLFQATYASDGITNLRSSEKAEKLVDLFGKKNFVYAGNSRHDLPVWEAAGEAIAVNTPARILDKLRQSHPTPHIFEEGLAPKERQLAFYSMSQFLAALVLFLSSFITGKSFFSYIPDWFLMGFTGSAGVLLADILNTRALRLDPGSKARFLLATGAIPIATAWTHFLAHLILSLLFIPFISIFFLGGCLILSALLFACRFYRLYVPEITFIIYACLTLIRILLGTI